MASRSQLPGLDAAEREQVLAAPAPTHARLMKAVLSREAFSDPHWLFERKLDGSRNTDGIRRRSSIYYVFDLLWLDGLDTRALALRTRKRLLRDTVASGGRLRLSTHRNEAGEAMFGHACRQGWEGVVAKRADSPYRETRSRDWVKFKCEAGQELVIGGFTAPRGSRTELVAEVAFTEWTNGGRLRHPRYLGLREDKAAEQVVREG